MRRRFKFPFFLLWALGLPLGAHAASCMLQVKKVFIILEENHEWDLIHPNATATYINNTLLAEASWCTQYFGGSNGTLHPSEPNYFWIAAGTNFGLTSDNDPSSSNEINSTQHIESLLNNAGHTWKSYQEDAPAGVCPITSSGNYAAKHDPAVFFVDDVGSPPSSSNAYCIAHVGPFTQLATDLTNNTVADYNFITPNLQDDMHNGTIAQGDAWLKTNIPLIMASQAYQDNGAIFITWDESYNSAGSADTAPVGMIVLSPLAKGGGYTNAITYSHSSLLKSVQEIFSVTPLLGDAASAGTTDLSDLFQTACSVSSATPTSTQTPSRTPASTKTPVLSPSSTSTVSPSASPTCSITAMTTPTFSSTATKTVVQSQTSTFSSSPTFTDTPSVIQSRTSTDSPSPTFTDTATVIQSQTSTDSPSPTFTDTPSVVQSQTSTNSPSPTFTDTPSLVQSQTSTSSPSPTFTGTASVVQSQTSTSSPSPMFTDTPSVVQSQTSTNSPSPTFTDTLSVVQSQTSTSSPSPTFTDTPSVVQSQTSTSSPSPTFTNTATVVQSQTSTSSSSPTFTDTPTVAQSGTSTNSPSPTFTDTPSVVQSQTLTNSPSPTFTDTPNVAQSPTVTGSFSATWTDTMAATPILSPVPTASPTATVTVNGTATSTKTTVPTPVPVATVPSPWGGPSVLAPDPVRNGQTLTCWLGLLPSSVEWSLYTVAGGLVVKLHFGADPRPSWQVKNLSSGLYFLVLHVNAGDLTQKRIYKLMVLN